MHASWLLFLLWSVYLYRDVWPLATVDLVPADMAEGTLLWVKIALLSIVGFVIPIVIPRKYTPINMKVGRARDTLRAHVSLVTMLFS